jgi:hypothetical protein
MLLSEVEDFIKIAKESVEGQKRIYTYDEIKELEEKVSKKYSDLYRRKVFKKSSLEGRKICRLYHTYIVMKYLKAVMEITNAKDTKYVNFDMPGLSLEVLKITDQLGYIKHMENINKKGCIKK